MVLETMVTLRKVCASFVTRSELQKRVGRGTGFDAVLFVDDCLALPSHSSCSGSIGMRSPPASPVSFAAWSFHEHARLKA
jgi:hypothetical protein